MSDADKFKVGIRYAQCGYCGAEAFYDGLTWDALPHHPNCPRPKEPSSHVVTAIDEKAGVITIDSEPKKR